MTCGSLKNLFQPGHDFAEEEGECRPSMIDEGLRNGPNNALRHDARSRNLEKGTACHRNARTLSNLYQRCQETRLHSPLLESSLLRSNIPRQQLCKKPPATLRRRSEPTLSLSKG